MIVFWDRIHRLLYVPSQNDAASAVNLRKYDHIFYNSFVVKIALIVT